jgi:hypothetical protein
MGEKMQQKLESSELPFLSLSLAGDKGKKPLLLLVLLLLLLCCNKIDENLGLFSGIWQAPKLLRDSKRNA